MVHEIGINGHRLSQWQCRIILEALKRYEPDEPDDQREHLLSMFDDPMDTPQDGLSDKIGKFFGYLALVVLFVAVFFATVVFLKGLQ